MTVAELLRRISSRELSEWQALSRLELAEERRRDLERKAQAAVDEPRSARPRRRR